jgi:micrococcal nuclease
MSIRSSGVVVVSLVFLCIAQPVFAGSMKRMVESNPLLMKLLFALPFVQPKKYHTVEDVLSANTFRLDDGRRVRLIGVGLERIKMRAGRENHVSAQAVEKDALRYVRSLMLDREVRLEFDRRNVPPLDRGQHGSIPAYVYLKDGTLVNAEIIKQGYGNTASVDFQRSSAFKALEQDAEHASRGLWAQLNP